jgi:hypothetical protein
MAAASNDIHLHEGDRLEAKISDHGDFVTVTIDAYDAAGYRVASTTFFARNMEQVKPLVDALSPAII